MEDLPQPIPAPAIGRTIATLLVVGLVLVPAAAAQDPAGGAAPDAASLAGALDIVWILVAAALVFFMQAGFMLLGAGALRAKNTINYLTKSTMDFALGALAFFTVGYALMFGAGDALVGWTGFLLQGVAQDPHALIVWLFQMMFAATAATIVAGAVAERLKLGAYVAYSVVITALIYPVFGHWMWGGGWLSTLPWGAGAVDFAGSGVVHALGGLLALVAAWLVGPRIGRYREDGTLCEIPGHNVTYVSLGTFVLFLGWFGFNAGSTLSATSPLLPRIAANTFLAGSAGGVAVFLVGFLRGRTDYPAVCNGILAGLVAITAGCAYVEPWAALVVGFLAGPLYLATASLLATRVGVDDPVGAVAVHGANGLWGLLAVGVFADGSAGVSGLVVGSWSQLAAQAVAATAVVVWALATGLALFGVLKATVGLRVSREEELTGIDLGDHGQVAYPEFLNVAALLPREGGKR